MEHLVSVIIPVYNRQDYIEECIASLQAQTYIALEIIVIDDGSTDATFEICRKLTEKEPRIRLLEANHGGVSAARNLGLEAAQGEYVFFLDSDDVIHPLLIQTLVENLQSTGAEMAATTNFAIQQKYWHNVRKFTNTDTEPVKAEYKDPEKTLHEAMTKRSPFSVIGGSMIRRTWVGDTKFRTDLYIGEDFYFLYENLIKGANAVFLRNKWYYNRLHDTNSSWDWTYSGFQNRFYRRRLVWESEDRFGRHGYANIQKQKAFLFFIRFIQFKHISAVDKKKMRAVMKEHKKAVLPGLTFLQKGLFVFSVFMPFTYPVWLPLLRLYQKRKK